MIKNLTMLTICTLILTVNVGYAQTKTEKTLVKSFNLQGKETVLLDLGGNVEVKSWDSKIMRIQMEITLEDAASHMIKSLVQVGRYNLKAEFQEDFMLVAAPAMRKEIRVRGQLLKENVVYTVFTPKDVIVKMADEASASADSGAIVPSSK